MFSPSSNQVTSTNSLNPPVITNTSSPLPFGYAAVLPAILYLSNIYFHSSFSWLNIPVNNLSRQLTFAVLLGFANHKFSDWIKDQILKRRRNSQNLSNDLTFENRFFSVVLAVTVVSSSILAALRFQKRHLQSICSWQLVTANAIVIIVWKYIALTYRSNPNHTDSINHSNISKPQLPVDRPEFTGTLQDVINQISLKEPKSYSQRLPEIPNDARDVTDALIKDLSKPFLQYTKPLKKTFYDYKDPKWLGPKCQTTWRNLDLDTQFFLQTFNCTYKNPSDNKESEELRSPFAHFKIIPTAEKITQASLAAAQLFYNRNKTRWSCLDSEVQEALQHKPGLNLDPEHQVKT